MTVSRRTILATIATIGGTSLGGCLDFVRSDGEVNIQIVDIDADGPIPPTPREFATWVDVTVENTGEEQGYGMVIAELKNENGNVFDTYEGLSWILEPGERDTVTVQIFYQEDLHSVSWSVKSHEVEE